MAGGPAFQPANALRTVIRIAPLTSRPSAGALAPPPQPGADVTFCNPAACRLPRNIRLWALHLSGADLPWPQDLVERHRLI